MSVEREVKVQIPVGERESNNEKEKDFGPVDFINLCVHLEEKQSILSRRRKILCDKVTERNFKVNKEILDDLQKYLTGSQDVEELYTYMKKQEDKFENIESLMPDSYKSYKSTPPVTNPPENNPESLYYESITKETRGHVLIVNYRSHRDGSDNDVVRLEKVFKKLKYEIQTEYDLKKEVLFQTIKDFANNKEHDKCHAAGLIIMSHGQDGAIIIGKDGEYCQDKTCPRKYDSKKGCKKEEEAVETMKILAEFNSDKLKGKPTFVFFQVCRPPFTIDGNKTVASVSDKTNTGKGDNGKGDNVTSYCVKNLHPTIQNRAILFTCRPSFLSGRHPTKGAYFIQAICDVLQAKGEKMSLDQLFPKIALKNRTMNIVEYANSEAIVPEMVTTMNKKFRF